MAHDDETTSHLAVPGSGAAATSGGAAAGRGGTAVVGTLIQNQTVYQGVRARPIAPEVLAAGEGRLATLPLDAVPAQAPLPQGSRMLLTVNPLFVGRTADLCALAKTLKAGGTAAITGLGGLGKTQLAVEFVHRYGQFFAGVFWLSFADVGAIPTQVAECGRPGYLDLRPDFDALPLEDQQQLVLSAWQSGLPYLLVFDNCEDEGLLARWRPPTGGCRVLVTSRRAEWEASLGMHALPLGVLSRPESMALLRYHRPDLPADDATLDAIAAELGDLPLALHLAGSFLARYRYALSPVAYLVQLRRPDLLQHRSLQGEGRSPTGHVLHVAQTFVLSYERLQPSDPVDGVALALLQRAAYLAPGEPIPRDLLLATLGLTDEDLDGMLQAEDGLRRLGELGLLETEAEGALRLHRLLAAFVRDAAPDVRTQVAVEETLLEQVTALNVEGYPARLLQLQPHLRAVTERAIDRADECAAALCAQLGCHLRMVGAYQQARPFYERALAIDEAAHGPDHPTTATSLNNFALLLRDQGDYAAARSLFERALAIREQALGPTHPATAISLNSLALLLRDQGDYAAARPLFERALAIREQALGPQHPDTATTHNNLALLLWDQGEFAAAKPLFEQALAIAEQTLGPQHPNTALALNNLALLLRDQGDYAAAKSFSERALTITEQTFTHQHPNTALALNNLAILLQDQGDYAAARPLFERALAIYQQTLGPDHPNTVASLSNLATLLQDQGDYAAARPLFERALVIDEAAHGYNHPSVANDLNNLACLLQAQGDYAATQPLFERALAVWLHVLGPDHPTTATSLNNLAGLLRAQGDLAAARPLFERALAITEQVLGPDHPTTRTIRANLAALDTTP